MEGAQAPEQESWAPGRLRCHILPQRRRAGRKPEGFRPAPIRKTLFLGGVYRIAELVDLLRAHGESRGDLHRACLDFVLDLLQLLLQGGGDGAVEGGVGDRAFGCADIDLLSAELLAFHESADRLEKGEVDTLHGGGKDEVGLGGFGREKGGLVGIHADGVLVGFHRGVEEPEAGASGGVVDHVGVVGLHLDEGLVLGLGGVGEGVDVVVDDLDPGIDLLGAGDVADEEVVDAGDVTAADKTDDIVAVEAGIPGGRGDQSRQGSGQVTGFGILILDGVNVSDVGGDPSVVHDIEGLGIAGRHFLYGAVEVVGAEHDGVAFRAGVLQGRSVLGGVGAELGVFDRHPVPEFLFDHIQSGLGGIVESLVAQGPGNKKEDRSLGGNLGDDGHGDRHGQHESNNRDEFSH
ncbi:hypothetical protein SDC9_24543 [bioreactor metagenome]|uniref:Uncharacterized protein n=1 Tax=bioreactor metagenome TaxID=1076179 RepID=A0A644UIP5_9ZZZZ